MARRRSMRWKRYLPWIFGGAAGVTILGAVIYALGGKKSAGTASHDIADLTPELRQKFLALEARLAGKGIKLVVGDTKRTASQQEDLVDAGKSATARSKHLKGEALDVYVVDPATGKADTAGKRQDLYRILHQEWSSLGGYGLAFWPYPNGPVRYIKTSAGNVWDAGHLQLTPVPAPPTQQAVA